MDAAAAEGSLWRVDGKDVLRFERTFAHPVDRVWRALTDPDEVTAWTTATMRSDGVVGGRITFAFANSGSRHDGTITALDPPRVFEYTWEDDILRWELVEAEADADPDVPDPDTLAGPRCRLVFTHTFAGRVNTAVFAAGWHTHLEQLDALTDGAPIPWSADRWIEHKQAYAARFDTSGRYGRLTLVDGRARVQFTRLLAYPREEIFRAVTDNTMLREWYPATIEGERSTGAAIELHATDYEFPPAKGEILAYDPPHRIEYTWDGERIRFEIWDFGGAFGGRCRLVFTDQLAEPFDGDIDGHATMMGAWHHGIERLEALLAGRPIPISEARIGELAADYPERIALPNAGGRSLLKLERTIAHPIEVVWDALTDPAAIRQWMDPVEMELAHRPGDTFEVVYRGFDEPPGSEEIRVRERPHELSYTWAGDVVRWQLAQSSEGCRLLCTIDFAHEPDLGCVAGWNHHHDLLEALLDGDVTALPDRPYGTLATLDGRPVFCFSRRLGHAPEKVWRALTDPEHLASWFPSGMEMTLEPGSQIRFPFEGDDGPVLTGRLSTVEPPNVLAYTWGDDVLRWEIEPVDDGVRLYLTTMTDSDHEQTLKNAAGWHSCVDLLEGMLDGRSAPDEGWKEHYLAYNRRLEF